MKHLHKNKQIWTTNCCFFCRFHSRHIIHTTRMSHMSARHATQAARKNLLAILQVVSENRPDRNVPAFLLRASGATSGPHRKQLSQRAESVSPLSVSIPPAGDRVPNILQSVRMVPCPVRILQYGQLCSDIHLVSRARSAGDHAQLYDSNTLCLVLARARAGANNSRRIEVRD